MPSRLKRYVRRYRSRAPRKYARRSYRKIRSNGRRRRYAKGRMSRRRIINMTATKKRDNMIPYNPITDQNYSSIPFGTTAHLWCATARPLSLVTAPPRRTATTVYQKGLRDHVQIDISDGSQLRWRRIVFETRGYRDEDFQSIDSYIVRRMVRPMTPAKQDTLTESLFEGTAAEDWTTYFTAKVDTNQVKVHSDKIRVLRAGNDAGHTHSFRFYYPLEKNMTYDEDEREDVKSSSLYASPGLKGMGDLFVVDFFQNVGSNPDDWNAIWRANATLYWHEK